MTHDSPPQGGLAVLAEAFRARRTGVLVVGQEPHALRVRLEAGQIVALGPAGDAAPLPKPSDSVRLRLERVLSEVGVRKAKPASAAPADPGSLRDRLIERLADLRQDTRFDEAKEAPQDLVAVAVATEPLILETVRQMRQDEAVRRALGDLDRRLVATTVLADERTLTLTEGYLLSRIDGQVSVREVLDLVPLEPQEAERTLLGLVLTGRVECRPAETAARRTAAQPEGPRAVPPVEAATAEPSAAGPPVESAATSAAEPAPEAVTARAAETPAADSATAEAAEEGPAVEAIPDDESDAPAAGPESPTGPMPVQAQKPPLDAATLQRRREILEFFQALPLKNHFEVLGVEAGCDDAEVRRAYVSLAKRFHPDAQRDPRLADMHDIMEAIFIRVGEAWEVLGEARSRASYESRSGIVRRPKPAATAAPAASETPPGGEPPAAAAPAQEEPAAYVPPEEILFRARRMLAQARYWDAIQMLEMALPGMEPRSQQHRGRLLLARAYSKNPNWLRRAEEMLQELLREDPTNADVHYELGLVYKTGGFVARAQGMFKRALELRPGHKEASAELGLKTDEGGDGGGGLLKRLFRKGKAS